MPIHHGDDIAAVAEHSVNQTVLARLECIHPAIALEHYLDLLPDVAGLLGDDVEKLCLKTLLLAQCDAHVLGIALRTAAGRMHVNCRVGQGVAFALFP